MIFRRALLWGWGILSAAWLVFIIVWVEIVNCLGPDAAVLCAVHDPNSPIMPPAWAIGLFGIGFPLAALFPVMLIWWLTGSGCAADPEIQTDQFPHRLIFVPALFYHLFPRFGAHFRVLSVRPRGKNGCVIVSVTAANITSLRASLAGGANPQKRVPLGFKDADACLKGGLPCGALHEIFADPSHEAAASAFTAALAFRLAAKKRVLWIRQDFSALEFGELAATGLLELGLDPARFLVLRLSDVTDILRAACDALSCAALGAVVMEFAGEPKILDLVASRRLTLACTHKGVTAFLLRFNAKPEASAAETRWLIRSAMACQVVARAAGEDWGRPVFETQLLRNRHGGLGRWVMEWNCDDGLFRKADSRAVVSASGDRPLAAAVEGAASRYVA